MATENGELNEWAGTVKDQRHKAPELAAWRSC